MMEYFTISLAKANAYVRELHRHHKPVRGHKFSIAAIKDGKLAGVSIVGRPVNRYRDDGSSLEVLRLCTDGTRNACSFLYAKSAQAGKALGYYRIGTYILGEELGTSLEASGWIQTHTTAGGNWSSVSRDRASDKFPETAKKHYEKVLMLNKGAIVQTGINKLLEKRGVL